MVSHDGNETRRPCNPWPLHFLPPHPKKRVQPSALGSDFCVRGQTSQLRRLQQTTSSSPALPSMGARIPTAACRSAAGLRKASKLTCTHATNPLRRGKRPTGRVPPSLSASIQSGGTGSDSKAAGTSAAVFRRRTAQGNGPAAAQHRFGSVPLCIVLAADGCRRLLGCGFFRLPRLALFLALLLAVALHIGPGAAFAATSRALHACAQGEPRAAGTQSTAPATPKPQSSTTSPRL